MKIKTSSLLLAFFLLALISCKQKQTDLDFLEKEMKKMGYEGTYERPSGVMQKTALGLLGVKDVIVFNSGNNNLLIAQLRNENDKDIVERLETLLSIVEPYISEKDRKEIYRSKEMIREHSQQHNHIVLLWQEEKPEDLARLIRRNY